MIFRLLGKGGGGSNSGGNSGNNGGHNGNGSKGIDKVKNKDLDKQEREKKKEQAKARGYRQKGKYTNRGKHLGWYKNGKLQDQVVITNYLNDVSDPLTQVLMTYGEDGKYDAAYTYGLELIEVETA